MAFGEYGLKATDRARMTAREIEAARRAMARYVKRGGRSGSACSRTCRSPRSRSKCAWAAARATSSTGSREVQPGKVLFEIEGVSEDDRARGVPPRLREALGVHGVREAAGAAEDGMRRRRICASKAPAELGEELLKLRREQFNLRMAARHGPGREARPVRARCARTSRA